MNFGEITELLRDGTRRACREGWNGKNMWIYVEVGKTIPFSVLRDPIKSWLNGDMIVLSHFNMKAADGKLVCGWLASQTDMLANDWMILTENQDR